MLYFAGVRDLVGVGEETLALPAEVRTVAELASHLEKTHPELSGRLGGVRFAIDEEFASPGDALCNDCVVAVIPPVAGG